MGSDPLTKFLRFAGVLGFDAGGDLLHRVGVDEVVALLDGVCDFATVGVTVHLYDEATETEDRCTAILLRIKLLLLILDGALNEGTSYELDRGGLDCTHDLT